MDDLITEPYCEKCNLDLEIVDGDQFESEYDEAWQTVEMVCPKCGARHTYDAIYKLVGYAKR